MEIFWPADAESGMVESANVQQINNLFTLCMAFFGGKRSASKREYMDVTTKFEELLRES
jgi:hypothetical protein